LVGAAAAGFEIFYLCVRCELYGYDMSTYRNLVGWETYHDHWALVDYAIGSDAEATHNIILREVLDGNDR